MALFSTDTTGSVAQIIEYHGTRWKIEAAFKELKRDIGSAETQTSKMPIHHKIHDTSRVLRGANHQTPLRPPKSR